MKKNDVFSYLAYALMLVLGICIGLLVLRPELTNGSTYLTMHPFLLIFLSIIAGIVITALILELGHLVGAKIGKYKIEGWICLGIGFKKDKNDKNKFFVGGYDGLTGETNVTPLDKEKSNPRISIYFSLLFILIEIAIFAGLVVFSSVKVSGGETNFYWIKPASIIVLTIVGIVLIYDLFPAQLDSKNDGYLITIFNHKVNVVAYNEMLLMNEKITKGLPVEDAHIYDEVTDFTSKINDITLYAKLDEGKYDEALDILEKTLKSEDKVSSSVFLTAEAQKIAILLDNKPLEEAKKYYISLPIDVKKHITALNNAPSIRAYVLANGLINESYSETENALNKVHDVYRKLPKDKKDIEKKLLKLAMDKVLCAHQDWDFSDYGYSLNKCEDNENINNVDNKEQK